MTKAHLRRKKALLDSKKKTNSFKIAYYQLAKARIKKIMANKGDIQPVLDVMEVLLLIGIQSLNAQVKVEPDSIKLSNNNCATRLARDYMSLMGTIESVDSKQEPLRSSEILKGSEFEKETNGVFIISTLNSHKRKLIVLKRESQIKISTFNDVSKSLIELISFLNDLNSSNQELFSYLHVIEDYIKNSKNVINKVYNSDWIKCDSVSLLREQK